MKITTFYLNGKLFISFLIIMSGFLFSCKRNPIDRLTDPRPDGAVPQSSGVYTVYDDELRTGGGLAFIPGGENQSIDLKTIGSPRLTVNSIRYHWNGGDVLNASASPSVFQHLFAGFMLTVTPDATTLAGAAGKNLSAPGYTVLKFFVRGNLASGTKLRIEGPDDGDGGITPARVELDSSTVTSNWQSVSLSIPSAHFSNVKIFMIATCQFSQPPRTTTPGEGCDVYFDDIRYER